jgi:hypothetical protein
MVRGPGDDFIPTFDTDHRSSASAAVFIDCQVFAGTVRTPDEIIVLRVMSTGRYRAGSTRILWSKIQRREAR